MEAIQYQIRSAEPDDYGAMQALHAQPKVIHGTMQLPFPSRELWRRRCSEASDNLRVLLACVQQEVVGCGAIRIPAAVRRRHVGELGLSVHDAWHRRGVGASLIGALVDLGERWLNLSRLELTVYTDNAPAIALYEKFGFRREGLMERYAFRDGEYADVYAMARINRRRSVS